MEADIGQAGSRPTRALLLLLALTVALRLPFVTEAIQGDDHIYLTEAAHAQIDPLHPKHTPYVFRGELVDLRGQPHPPLNGWILAGLLAVMGDVREVPFHAAYILFSLIAVASMWSLARRFSPQPLWAALLFVATPVFLVNGTSLESDLPFLAFWMASIALFCADRIAVSVLMMAPAALGAYQSILLTPVLAAWLWLRPDRGRVPRLRWLAIFTAPLVLIAWQIFERVTTGAFPAAVLAGYLSVLETAHAKLSNAIALTIHSWFLVCPILVPAAAVAAWRARRDRSLQFLLAWIAIFFAGALIIFFAGAARYLLPIAAPAALLASRLRPRWLAFGVAANLVLGLGLAAANWQHWDAYRRFAQDLAWPAKNRVWVDGEWGLRYYLERRGALPLLHSQKLREGDVVVSSELARAVDVTAPLVPVAAIDIRPSIPLRLIGLDTRSAWSTVSRGYWPFGISTGVVDRVTAAAVGQRHPALEYLPMNAPEAAAQIVGGIYGLEDNRYRWMAGRAIVALKSPAEPAPLRAEFFIPEQAAARQVRLLLDGREVAAASYTSPGRYTLQSSDSVQGAIAEIIVDKTFRAPPDARDLGIVLEAIGFR